MSNGSKDTHLTNTIIWRAAIPSSEVLLLFFFFLLLLLLICRRGRRSSSLSHSPLLLCIFTLRLSTLREAPLRTVQHRLGSISRPSLSRCVWHFPTYFGSVPVNIHL